MRVVLLCGGVGGAKLADGLARVLPPERLVVVVNTGDDFRHWGVQVSPDLDSVTYTLAGRVHPEQGWGRADETYQALAAMGELGGETWFRLGDRDLATHLRRTERLSQGARLTEVTAELTRSLGVRHRVLPMCDSAAPTRLDTPEGVLDFQEWFVRRRAAPPVRAVLLPPPPLPSPELRAALDAADAVVLAPSNPYVSLGPILNVQGVAERVRQLTCVAVSPIVAGAAVKGPLAGMLGTLAGQTATARAALTCLDPLWTAALVHPGDGWTDPRGRPVVEEDVLLPTTEDRVRVAEAVVRLAEAAWR